jgi:serine/threonine protein kinase
MDQDPSIGEWDKIKVVGKGGSSTVFKARLRSTGQIVAVKQIETDSLSQVSGIQAEIDTIKVLNHPNVVTYLGTQRFSNKICIFLEYAGRGSLRQFYQKKGRLQESQVAYCTKQILLGLQYLHSNGIAHRDIKCANCLLAQGNTIKLADFGASKKFDSISVVSGLKGTPHWMAPEVIRGTQMTNGWMKADVWSLGCTVVELLTGKVPFADYENPMTAMYHIANGKAPPIKDVEASIEIVDFLKICCAPEAANRPTVDVLLDHPFITRKALSRMNSTNMLESTGSAKGSRTTDSTANDAVEPHSIHSTGEYSLPVCNTFEDLFGVDENKDDYDDDDFEEYLPTVAEESMTSMSMTVVAGNPYATKNAAVTAKGYVKGWDNVCHSPQNTGMGFKEIRPQEKKRIEFVSPCGKERYAEVDFDLNADIQDYCRDYDEMEDSQQTINTHTRGASNLNANSIKFAPGIETSQPGSSSTMLQPLLSVSRGSTCSRGGTSGSMTEKTLQKSSSTLGILPLPNKMVMLPSPVSTMHKSVSDKAIGNFYSELRTSCDSIRSCGNSQSLEASIEEEVRSDAESVCSVQDEDHSGVCDDCNACTDEDFEIEAEAYDDAFEQYISPKTSPKRTQARLHEQSNIRRVSKPPTKEPTTTVIKPTANGLRKSVIEMLDDAKVDPSCDMTITVEMTPGKALSESGKDTTTPSSKLESPPVGSEVTSLGRFGSAKSTSQKRSQMGSNRLGSRQNTASRQHTAQSVATPTTHSALSTPFEKADFMSHGAPIPSREFVPSESRGSECDDESRCESDAKRSTEFTPAKLQKSNSMKLSLSKQDTAKLPLHLEKSRRKKDGLRKDCEGTGASAATRINAALGSCARRQLADSAIDCVGKQMSAAVRRAKVLKEKSVEFNMPITKTSIREKTRMKPHKLVKSQSSNEHTGVMRRSQATRNLFSSTVGANAVNKSNAANDCESAASSQSQSRSRSKSAPLGDLQTGSQDKKTSNPQNKMSAKAPVVKPIVSGQVSIPLVHDARTVQSAPTLSRATNLPPILESATPGKKHYKSKQGVRQAPSLADPGSNATGRIGFSPLKTVKERR